MRIKKQKTRIKKLKINDPKKLKRVPFKAVHNLLKIVSECIMNKKPQNKKLKTNNHERKKNYFNLNNNQ